MIKDFFRWIDFQKKQPNSGTSEKQDNKDQMAAIRASELQYRPAPEELKLRVVESLYPQSKPQITSLGDRLYEILEDYRDQEHEEGRMVTTAEIVGTLDILIDRVKGY